MNIQIALSPELETTSFEFAQAWNETPDAHEVATARVETAHANTYDPMMVAGLTILSSMLVNVASSMLYDLIKEALAKRGITRRIVFVERVAPDGTRMIVVEIEEEAT